MLGLTAPKDTIAWHSTRPMFAHRDMSHVPMREVAGALKAFIKSPGFDKTLPETDALWFYMMNHATALIGKRHDRMQPLGEYDEIYDVYASMNTRVVRMFYYLLVICIRESRHLKTTSAIENEVKTNWGTMVWNFIRSIPDSASSAMTAIIDDPSDCRIGDVVQAMGHCFYEGNWNSQYGGKKWGAINDVLEAFVYGKYSGEMMMDTAFTLAHNNGPIFNKGMLYKNYHSKHMLCILDVQRAGMIPQYLNGKTSKSYGMDADLLNMHQRCKALMKDEFSGNVDWDKVMELGSVGKYQNVKSKVPAKSKPEPEMGWFHITPQDCLAKVSRQEMKAA